MYTSVLYACLQIRSETIATYALCGFANIGSLGIVIGGLSKWQEYSSTTDVAYTHFGSPSCSVRLFMSRGSGSSTVVSLPPHPPPPTKP
jgi:hypothetical protein